MYKKTNPIIIIRTQNLQNVSYLQQTYNNNLFPYVLNEQELLIEYATTFLRHFGLSLHSLKIVKNVTGKCFIIIRFFFCVEGTLRNSFARMNFINLEKAFSFGVCNILKTSEVIISFFDILKSKTNIPKFLPTKTLSSWKFFSNQELEKSIQLLIKNRGGASFLAFFIAFKLGCLRSKLYKKLQVPLINSFKTITLHLIKHNPIIFRGIKIVIKGRINGTSRSKKWMILDGSLALQQIHQELEYSYTPAVTVFGSFGVKVWVNYRKFGF